MSQFSIVLGEDEKNPLIEIRVVDKINETSYTRFPHLDNLKSFASVAVQAVPSLLTQAEFTKSSIMEVVVNGSLTSAIDGNGFRAMVKGADGKIIENARLYNADKLSSLINVAAVWQILSVVVAQKHLADINQKLDDLKEGVNRIQDFQKNDRESSIYMVSNKLKEKIMIFTNLKNQEKDKVVSLVELNSYDDTLEKIYLHLKADLKNYGLKKTEHKEFFGTADYKVALEKRLEEIQENLILAYLSLNLRSMNNSLIEYLGTNVELVAYRTGEVKKEIENLKHLIDNIGENITKEVKELKSRVNDAQSFVVNNKNSIALSGTAAFISAPLAVGIGVAVMTGSLKKTILSERVDVLHKKVFGESKKLDLLEERKLEMLEMLEISLNLSQQQAHYSMGLLNTNLLHMIEKEEPIKLAFQKLDEEHVLCLNTNEKIAI
ncbi:hypothetical protein [Acinetobacter sp. ESBL14]|uniref:hypothetical protein n=1 Tax=Acinetobacter sp. ESBL14 TaxID=3077329 RepID=UPI002FCC0104